VLGGLDSDGAPLKDVFAFDSRPRSGSGAWVAAQASSPPAARPHAPRTTAWNLLTS
jgi:hypothetical protein